MRTAQDNDGTRRRGSKHRLGLPGALWALIAALAVALAGLVSVGRLTPAFAHVIDAECTTVGVGIDIRGEFQGTTDEAAVGQLGDTIEYTVTVDLGATDCPITDGVVTITLPDGTSTELDSTLALSGGGSSSYIDAVSYTIAAADIGMNGAPADHVRASASVTATSHRASGIDQEVTAGTNFDTLVATPLTITKDATPSFNREFPWEITKAVDPDHWNLFDGDTGTSTYSVTVTKGDPVDSAFAVSGTITVMNPNSIDVEVQSVTDEITDGIAATVDCGGDFPMVLAAGGTLVCTYSADLPDGTSRVNTATVEASFGLGGTATADVDFTGVEPSEVINDQMTVSDTNPEFGGDQTTSESATFTYDLTFDCEGLTYEDGHASFTHDNTASIVELDQSATASVAVDCYQLNVTKDIAGTQDIDYDWNVLKTADPETQSIAEGGSADVTWTVTADLAGTTTSQVAIAGQISIVNPNPDREAIITNVSDELDSLTVTVDCGGPGPYTIAPGGSLDCTYEATGETAATFENVATATQQNFDFSPLMEATESGTTDYSGSATLEEGAIQVNATDFCANVVDIELGLNEQVCADGELPAVFSGVVTYGPEGLVCGDNQVSNTATLTEADSGDTSESTATATITVDCILQGCTPGYWKQPQHFDSWVDFSPDDLFDTVFGVDVTLRGNGRETFDDPTLLQALDANGGGVNALARHAVAALLNASNPDVQYALSVDEVIAMTQDAIASEDFETTKDIFATNNEAGCPLN